MGFGCLCRLSGWLPDIWIAAGMGFWTHHFRWQPPAIHWPDCGRGRTPLEVQFCGLTLGSFLEVSLKMTPPALNDSWSPKFPITNLFLLKITGVVSVSCLWTLSDKVERGKRPSCRKFKRRLDRTWQYDVKSKRRELPERVLRNEEHHEPKHAGQVKLVQFQTTHSP